MARHSDRSKPSSPPQDQDGPEPALRAMAAEGLIRRAARKGPMPAARWRPVKVTGKPVSQTIIDDRDDRA
jgi:hypothetical protein